MIHNILKFISENDFNNFRCGYVAGIAVVILLFVLILLLYYILKSRRKVNAISVPTNNGELSIATGAIVDLVKIVAADFRYITVPKVSLIQCRKGVMMNMKVKYDINGKPFPDLADELQEAVLKELDIRLGINSISFVKIKLVGTSSGKIN
jgi:hypothetical protein